MAKTLPQVADSTALSALGPLRDSFLRHLAAENKSPNTILTYGKAVEQLDAFLLRSGMPTAVDAITREHVESFLLDLEANGWKPSSRANRFRSLQQFFKWLAAEGEIRESPMRNMRPPAIPEEPPAMLRDDELKALLATVDGTDFEARRDAAILSLLVDCGIRRAEIAGLRVADVDFDHKVVLVLGKGRRPRAMPVRAQDGPGARPLPAHPRPPPGRRRRTAVARQAGRAHRDRHRPGGQAARRAGRASTAAPAPLPAQLGARAARRGHAGGRPDAPGRLEVAQMVGRYGASAADERARAAYRAPQPAGSAVSRPSGSSLVLAAVDLHAATLTSDSPDHAQIAQACARSPPWRLPHG